MRLRNPKNLRRQIARREKREQRKFDRDTSAMAGDPRAPQPQARADSIAAATLALNRANAHLNP
jgi:hypothetical protein